MKIQFPYNHNKLSTLNHYFTLEPMDNRCLAVKDEGQGIAYTLFHGEIP
jgi:hypothetical protein